MNPALKQRLVGAAVLVALGIIFLPAIFNGGRLRREANLEEIPPGPVLVPVELNEPVRPEKAEKLGVEEENASKLFLLEAREQDGDEVARAIEAGPSLGKEGLPEAWVLQVASFSDDQHAEELKEKLQQKKYRAFIRRIQKDDKTLVRVMIGPEMDAGKLSEIKRTVDKEFKVKSLIVKFKP
jgi:DedD protein